MVRISRSRINLEDGRVDRGVFKKWGETLVGGAAGTNAGSTYTVDLENGNVVNLILNSADCAFTFSNPTGSGAACSFTLILTQDATGGRTATWPAAVKWPGGTAPTLSTVPTRTDVLSFLTTDGGSTWLGSVGAQNFSQISAINAVTSLGLTSNLRLCLDAGDSASYTSGQSWLDRSGNGYDFFRGADGSATATDPTFNGTAGNLSSSEYFSFDGGDYFKYDSANETWMNNLHKNNALYTFLAWIYPQDSASNLKLFGTRGTGSTTGLAWGIHGSNDVLDMFVTNGGSTVRYLSGAAVNFGAWQLASVSWDEAAGGSATHFGINAAFATGDGTYTSPSTGNASFTAQIAANGNAGEMQPNTARMAMFAAWEGVALTQTQIEAFYNATRGRFGV